MSNDNKTLADAQPGGRVSLGDQAERARFEAFLSGNPLMALTHQNYGLSLPRISSKRFLMCSGKSSDTILDMELWLS